MNESPMNLEILLTISTGAVLKVTPFEARELHRLLSDLFKTDPAFAPPGTWVSRGFGPVSK